MPRLNPCATCGGPREWIGTPSTILPGFSAHLVCRTCRIRWRTAERPPSRFPTVTWDESGLADYAVRTEHVRAADEFLAQFELPDALLDQEAAEDQWSRDEGRDVWGL